MSASRAAAWLALLLIAVASVVAIRDGALGQRASGAEGPPASSAAASPSATASTTGHAVLALGDSVPAGKRCDCRPFAATYASLLAQRTGVPVTVDNEAVSGLDTPGLVAQLATPQLQDAVRRSDIVLITIGANDFSDHHGQVVDGTCKRGDSDCVSDELDSMGRHLSSVLSTVRTLRAGAPTTILVTGYWNVFEDGAVARRAYGAAGLADSIALTRRANAVIESVSTAAGARYVDLFAPFQRHGKDITSLLAWDGDHPDAAGHALIARALLAAGLPRTS